jgi:hypothetical protein
MTRIVALEGKAVNSSIHSTTWPPSHRLPPLPTEIDKVYFHKTPPILTGFMYPMQDKVHKRVKYVKDNFSGLV